MATNRLFLLLYRNAHPEAELTPTERALKSIVESPLSVEILNDVILDIVNLSDELAQLQRGIRPDEILNILHYELNDWDK